MDENLDNNPFYRALLSSHRKQFDIASKKCYIIAIPKSDSIANITINNYVINSHILMPSRLLKMHYIPIEGGTTDIEIDTDKLILNGRNESSSVVRILREEIGYNCNNEQYRILIIDRPLTRHNAIQRRSLNGPSNGDSGQSGLINQNQNQTQVIKLAHHDDAHKLLERISQSLTNDLEASIRTLQSTYLILPRFLDDASARIKSLVDLNASRFIEIAFKANRSNSINGVTDETIQIAVEVYIVHLMHGRLIASIHQCYKCEDERVYQKCKEISSVPNVTVCDLGAQKSFKDFKVAKLMLAEVGKFDYLQSPLALVSSLTTILNLISEQLAQSARQNNLPTSCRSTSDKQICICSDDLIASLVLILSNAAPRHMYSVTKYIELFSWSSSSKDQAAYCVATFELVTNYLMSYVRHRDSITLL